MNNIKPFIQKLFNQRLKIFNGLVILYHILVQHACWLPAFIITAIFI